jgi:hypothetical protein
LRADGSFEFSQVPAGSYLTRVSGDPFGTPQRVEVGNQDVVGLQVPLILRWEVTGKITSENSEPLFYVPSAMMIFYRKEGGGFVPIQGPEGTFRARLPVEEYRITFDRMPPGSVLKSISAGDKDLLKEPFIVGSQPPSPIRITFGPPVVTPAVEPARNKENAFLRGLKAIGRWFSK